MLLIKYKIIMKKILVLITLSTFLFTFQVIQEQENDKEMKTIFGNKQNSNGGYGDIIFGYTQLDGKDAFIGGIKGGWLINHSVTLGLAGFGFINDISSSGPDGEYRTNLAGGYGGLLVEPVIAPNFPVHVTFPIIIGAGGISYYEDYWNSDNSSYPPGYYDGYLDSDAFFLFEPGMEIELNIVHFFRIAVGGSYRYTSDINLIDYNEDLLRNFNAYFTLNFGKF